jgi:hypothetical protein
MKISFNIQELLHCKSKLHETKSMHPFSSRAFQRDQEQTLKNPSLVDLININKTKQTSNSLRNGFAQCYMTMINILFQIPTPLEGK